MYEIEVVWVIDKFLLLIEYQKIPERPNTKVVVGVILMDYINQWFYPGKSIAKTTENYAARVLISRF